MNNMSNMQYSVEDSANESNSMVLLMDGVVRQFRERVFTVYPNSENALLPAFTRYRAYEWFNKLEELYNIHQLPRDEEKMVVVLNCLPEQYIAKIRKILRKPTINNKYEAIKHELISACVIRYYKDVRIIYNHRFPDSMCPSAVLLEIKRLTNKNVPEWILRIIWLKQFPEHSEVLIQLMPCDLNYMATVADKLWSYSTKVHDRQYGLIDGQDNTTRRNASMMDPTIGQRYDTGHGAAVSHPNVSVPAPPTVQHYTCRFHRQHGLDAINNMQPCTCIPRRPSWTTTHHYTQN